MPAIRVCVVWMNSRLKLRYMATNTETESREKAGEFAVTKIESKVLFVGSPAAKTVGRKSRNAELLLTRWFTNCVRWNVPVPYVCVEPTSALHACCSWRRMPAPKPVCSCGSAAPEEDSRNHARSFAGIAALVGLWWGMQLVLMRKQKRQKLWRRPQDSLNCLLHHPGKYIQTV